MTGPATTDLDLQPATEADHATLVGVVDEWFGGRKVRHLLPRSWFRHFGSSSFVARATDGAPIGFVVGFLSPYRADEAVIHLLAVHPNHRRRGLGRALVEAFTREAASTGRTVATAVVWADDPIAAACFAALGFRPDDGPGTSRLYGRPAYPDYDADGEDRAVFSRAITPLG